METGFLLQDLAAIMAAAAAVLFVCHKLRQPSVIGYIIAGLIIGPHMHPFSLVHDAPSIQSISQLGLIFLMFSLGLKFNLSRLRQAGFPAVVSAIIVVSGMLASGFALGKIFGWDASSSIILGCTLSICGSSIITKIFIDLKITNEPFARAVFGLMLCEDIAAMIMLSLISGLGAQPGMLAANALGAFVRVVFFILMFLILGLILTPKILAAVNKFRNRELAVITLLGLCFLSAVAASHFGFSIALGTFLMGAVISSGGQMQDAEHWIKPLRDMFSALFFVSAGMLADPKMILSNWPAVLLISLLVIFGRSFWALGASLIAGYDIKTSVKIGVSVSQIGEFSFIIASAGAAMGLVNDRLYAVAVAVSALTTFATPYFMRNLSALETSVCKIMPGKMKSALAIYHEWLNASAKSTLGGKDMPIFSNYFMRLAIYGALTAGLLYAGETITIHIEKYKFIVWILAGLVCVPLFMSFSRYLGHILLLTMTIIFTRFPLLKIFQRIDIHLAYKTITYSSVAVLSFGFAVFTAGYARSQTELLAVISFVVLTGIVFRKEVAKARVGIEKLLDHIIGLASSEPTHQAIVVRGSNQITLFGITKQILINEKSAAVGKTLRDIALQEKSGANVIAIYREGEHLPNPAPHTKIAGGDIVIILGDNSQCETAEKILEQEL